ncbi:MAG: hypothetical protein F6K41_14430 [Symploca sp. SIO3E6]|nr:hypothetical protein [Caldora sp. SIO3E6]
MGIGNRNSTETNIYKVYPVYQITIKNVKTVIETVPAPYDNNSITLTVSWGNIWYQQGLVKLIAN